MPYRHPVLTLGRLRHVNGSRTLVMGIVNVTPDSFSDGGRFATPAAAIAEATRHAGEGADIVDVGGESTRPGHTPVPVEEEIARVRPVIEGLSGRITIPISIDTSKAAVARAAIAAGATIVNDVWGLQRDPEMAAAVAEAGAGAIVMHNRPAPDPTIAILDDIHRFFDRSLALAATAGIPDERIVLDPGIGFGKTFEQNLTVLKHLAEFRRYGLPILIGLSRKSLIGRILEAPAAERLFSTLGANVLSILNGADILRVHDVRPHVEAAKVVNAIRRAA